MLEFLIDNIFVMFCGYVFQQIVGIPMRTNTQKNKDRTLRTLLNTVVNSYAEGLVVPAPLVTPFILITGNHLHS
jgi:hypothetical protein